MHYNIVGLKYLKVVFFVTHFYLNLDITSFFKCKNGSLTTSQKKEMNRAKISKRGCDEL